MTGPTPRAAAAPTKRRPMAMTSPDDYHPSPDDPYMNPAQLAYFRQKLEAERRAVLASAEQSERNAGNGDREIGDDADLADIETNRAMDAHMSRRYTALTAKLDAAIRRIDNGTYGYCLQTGEEIGIARLEARPTATLCVDAQELSERVRAIGR